MSVTYPRWIYFPRNTRPPSWVGSLIRAIATNGAEISTVDGHSKLTSDQVLQAIGPDLQRLGFEVETGKGKADKIRRPVLYGDDGRVEVLYEIDAAHDEDGVVVEVEAGRGARGNAAYRDLIRASLILDARYFVLLMPCSYRYYSNSREIAVAAYEQMKDQLNAIYMSQRLRLPFEGVLLIGY